ncbi:UDP-N-acetylglucosamine transferase subunit ALG14 homolog isoform X1 [Balaenoptera ricei]|uniref:UDP-N-acetylglucosamine transferase subunit ALG14 homolog isoform X1 n=1 Tax=Balaenoptera ricei TaxID=2746895 RepID=UPI0028BEB80A|nr:UDP-N-acetylglucosamine transferase subunit ALG14 homolog isoform X1 [Balaenoptera ricei]
MGGTLILAAAAGIVAVLLAVRLWVVLRPRAAVPRRSLSLLVVAGSGGHTTEILRLLENLSDAYSPRHYIIADTDEMSAHKINSFEVNRADRNPSAVFPEYYIHRIPRSREVQQSWLSTVLTTLYSLWLSFPLTHRVKPDLALKRGPENLLPQQKMLGLWPSSALGRICGRREDCSSVKRATVDLERTSAIQMTQGTVPHAAFVPCSTLGHTYHSSGQNVAIKASTQTTEVNCIFQSWPATCSEYDLAASSRRSGVCLLSLGI